MDKIRFNDQNKRLEDFRTEVWVVCPACGRKAVAQVDYQQRKARCICTSCGHTKEATTESRIFGIIGNLEVAAHHYFNAELWLQAPFKNEVFWAYNDQHLEYLASYIAAILREHKERSHFTLLEKLPRFYHEAKNRAALLKLIEGLRRKKEK